jgi:hypothetical protein
LKSSYVGKKEKKSLTLKFIHVMSATIGSAAKQENEKIRQLKEEEERRAKLEEQVYKFLQLFQKLLLGRNILVKVQ